MKFSHTLSLNANPDWANEYVDYAALKKLVNEVETAKLEQGEDAEAARKEHFLQELNKMVQKVQTFFQKTQLQLDRNLARLSPLLEKTSSFIDLAGLDLAVATERTPLKSVRSASTLGNMEDHRREICDLFTQYHNLKNYGDLNCTAVRKILKKYDKTNHDDLQQTYIQTLKAKLPFWDGTPEVDRSMKTLQNYYAHFYCQDDHAEALRRLQLMVREVISFQRQSVWLDVVQDQRRYYGAKVAKAKLDGILESGEGGSEDADQLRSKRQGGRGSLLDQLRNASVSTKVGWSACVAFVAILLWPGLFEEDPTKRNTLALFVLVSTLWAAESLPLFVTSLLVPFFAVTLRVIVVDGVRLSAREASKYVFGSMFSHVIMLLLGGFSIAAALSKHNIAQVMAGSISRQCGSNIRMVVLVNMILATGASMWISNVAAPVLCYSLVAPIFKASTAEQSRVVFGETQAKEAGQDQRMCRALVMGIALASNVGGMASPISSPQNLFAIEYTPMGWMSWFIVSIPLCLILDLILWVWLIICFQLPNEKSAAVVYALQRDRSVDAFSREQKFVMAVSIGTVLLWCASTGLESMTGQMGVLGIVPLVLFFGTGTLSKEDLNNFLWTVVLLAMGGLVLGEAVKMSGLLDVMAESIAMVIEKQQLSLWATFVTFTSLILVCTTFISHTVGAIIVIPIVNAVGSQMEPIPHSRELVFAAALACSAAMGLPVSGFPNMTAVGVEDKLGNPFLTTEDFLRVAVPGSLIALVVIDTLGFWLITVAVAR